MLRLAPVLLAAALAACVSFEEARMPPDPVAAGQRTVVVAFASPGPVMSETNENLNQAAKVIPGLGLVVSAGQGQKDEDASRELARRLPPWQAEREFQPLVLRELAASGYPGRLVGAAEAGMGEEALARLNAAAGITDWQRRFWLPIPENSDVPSHRDYSAFSLSDALILELNVGPGAPSDGRKSWTPTATCVAKLFRGSDMALLWRHEETLDDKPGFLPEAHYKNHPEELVARWQALLPPLARAVAASLRQSLAQAGAPAPVH